MVLAREEAKVIPSMIMKGCSRITAVPENNYSKAKWQNRVPERIDVFREKKGAGNVIE